MKTRVLLADDAMFMRFAIKNALQNDDFEIVAEASDGDEAVSMFNETRPDIVILDLTMPNKGGLEALQEIMSNDPRAKIVVACCSGEHSMVVEAMRSGASDYMVKPLVNPAPVIKMLKTLAAR